MEKCLSILGLIVLAMFPTRAVATGFHFECSDFRPMLQDDELQRPKPPDCVDYSFAGFSDQYDFENCRAEMERYRSKINSYEDCLASEGKSAADDYNDAVQKFNAKAAQ